MHRLKSYFRSFDSFIQLVYGLRRRIIEIYWRIFAKWIQNSTAKTVKKKIDNQSFLSRINHLLALHLDLQLSEEEKNNIRIEGDRSMSRIFNLLGSGDVTLEQIDWHADFKSGYRWQPGKFFKRYRQEGIESDSDVKIPRELSRFHHLLKLGLTYIISKDEKYARLCIRQIEDWIEANPLMLSINWGCTMDVSIRAINWIWVIALISGSKEIDIESIERIKVSLYQHGWFIYRNPEKGQYYNHNHYLADLSGQIHLGLLFENLDESRKWQRTGIEELFREIRLQILPSGMSYERATNYNRLVMELILIPILLLKKNDHEIPSDIWYRLEKMVEFIMYCLKPDGTSPIIGDQDNGRLLPFGVEPNNNFRYLLSLGALLFNRSDFKQYGEGFNIYCSLLGGKDALDRWNKISDFPSFLESKSFADSGVFILRKNDNYILFNATGKGMYPESTSGTHTHSDLLSFELVSKGKTFLVDPGSFIYTADSQQRMLFRSTKMHNTVTVDRESQNVIRDEVLWDFDRDAIPEIIKWESNETHDLIVARHTGYLRLNQPVIHKRSLIFDKQNSTWLITDELIGDGNHLFEWYFHFDTEIDFMIKEKDAYTNCIDGNNIHISLMGDKNLMLRKEESFVSKGYGAKESSFVLVASIYATCPTTLNIKINPT